MTNSTVPGAAFFDLLYTGGTFTTADNTAIKDLAFVVFDIVFLCLVLTWMGSRVGKARKKYKIDYPNLYAIAGTAHQFKRGEGLAPLQPITQDDADTYNCIQRGHQNTLETVPTFLALLIMGAFGFPALAGILGFVWIVGRIMYAAGYAVRPKARVAGAIVASLAMYSLVFMNFALFIYIASGKERIFFSK